MKKREEHTVKKFCQYSPTNQDFHNFLNDLKIYNLIPDYTYIQTFTILRYLTEGKVLVYIPSNILKINTKDLISSILTSLFMNT